MMLLSDIGQLPAASRLWKVPGQVNPATSLAFSRDGKRVVVSYHPGPILVCDVKSGESRSLDATIEGVSDCEFSRDGRRLVVASPQTASARVIDVETGSVLANLPGQRCVAFAPHDWLIAMESRDVKEFYPVELWDLATGRSVARLLGHKAYVTTAEFSGDGRLLATGSYDGTVIVWDLGARVERFALPAHSDEVRMVSFSMHDRSLLTASRDGSIKFWDLETGVLRLTLNVAPQLISLAVSLDGRTIVSGSQDADGSYHVDVWRIPME
jgi:WD40 repeat protein